MQLRSQLDARRLTLEFETERELLCFVDSAQEQGAFLLEMAKAPRSLVGYTVVLTLGSAVEHSMEASVVQVFEAADGVSVAFEIGPLPRTWETELKRKLALAAEPGGDHSEMTGTPPIVRIRKMNVRQRMHLATRADRVERAILLRDGSPQVLLGLVTNPRIAADDIVQILRNPQVSPGVIERISRERRWLANPEIQKALVRSPKTPSPIALRLMDSLPTEELRRVAKMQSGLRENLRKAALRVYLKRAQ